ncbi:MAG: type 4a pilus biogenesis protein PilO [Candidatus Aerophobetes bacterium]|nr:type 4a pilus biogenesis protein PilO [Candidatus Aerophobetes bacterium]
MRKLFFLTPKGRIVIGLGACLAIICTFYWGFYLPQLKLLKQIKRRISEEKLVLNRAKKELYKRDEIRRAYEKVKIRVSSLEESLSTEEQIYFFLQEIGVKAQMYGIDYVKIVPQEIVKGKYYNYLPVRMRFYSTYHTLGMLLSDISKKRVMVPFDVKEIRMKGLTTIEEKKKLNKKNTIDVEMLLLMYTCKKSFFKSPSKIEEGKERSSPLPVHRRRE